MATLTPTEQRRLGLVRPELMRNLLQLLDAAGQQLGYTLAVADNGGTRSSALQAQLYADSLAQGGGVLAYPVATPGHSRHEFGAAIDLHIVNGGSSGDGSGTDDDYRQLAELAESLPGDPGLIAGYFFAQRGVAGQDRYHFQLDEPLETSLAAWSAMQKAGIIKVAAVAGAALLLAALVRR